MPRGGSKKGEHRGGAKVQPWSAANLPEQNGVKPKGTKNKPKVEIGQEVMKILASKAEAATKERKLETYFLISGKRMRMPKEVMLEAMRFYEETAVEDVEIMQANLEHAGRVESEKEQEPFITAAAQAENRVRANLTMAVDIAYKVAPYVHPRLSAVMTNAGSGDSPLNVLAVLLQDLDEAGRPSRYIDHDPTE